MLLYFAILIILGCTVLARADHSPDNVLTFLLLGDWGKGGTSGSYGQRRTLGTVPTVPEDFTNNNELMGSDNDANTKKEKKVLRQMQVATAMGNYATKANPAPSFLIALGDNFYDNGVYSSTDALWQYLWKDVYLGFEKLNIPWFPILGNHDYGYGLTGVKAQLQRAKEHTDDDIWEMPSTNFTRRFDIPGKAGGSVAIIFIDTTTLAPSINRCCNSNGGVSETVQQALIANQLGHIERMLNDTLADPPTWLLVAGHYPIYSASSNGDVAELQTYLLPLLAKYKVHAYICGHDHIGEHLQNPAYDTQFFVVGAGTMVDTINSASTTKGSLVWAGPSYASFAAMNATTQDLTIAYHDTNGTLRYNYTMTNPNPNAVNNGGSDDEGGTGTDDGTGAAPIEDDTPSSSNSEGKSMLTWGYWSEIASHPSQRNITMASGGLAVLGLVAFLFFVVYRRDKASKEKGKSEFLARARNQEMLHSPPRGRSKNISSFYGRKKYAEIKAVGDVDLEEGGGGEAPNGSVPQNEDYLSDSGDEQDEYATMAPTVVLSGATLAAAALAHSPSSSRKSGMSRQSSKHTADDFPHRSRANTAHRDSVHSRNSSGSSFESSSSTNQGRYSHALTEEQSAAATAWLETHPSKTVSMTVGTSPPPPSPKSNDDDEHILSTGPLYNPLHVAQKLSPVEHSAASGVPKRSSPPKASQVVDESPSKPPKWSFQPFAQRQLAPTEGIATTEVEMHDHTATAATPKKKSPLKRSASSAVQKHRRASTSFV